MVESMVFVSCNRERVAGILQAAADARRIGNCDDSMKLDVVRFLEFEIQRYLKNFRLIIEEDRLFAREVMAAARCEPPEIIVRESVYIDALNDRHGARFILAHELGHVWLHHGSAAANDFAPHNFSTESDGVVDFRHFEWEANEFASEFLMPGYFAERLTPERASANYGVSLAFARKRLSTLARRRSNLNDRQRKRAWIDEWRKQALMNSGHRFSVADQFDYLERCYEPYDAFKYSDLDALTYSAARGFFSRP